MYAYLTHTWYHKRLWRNSGFTWKTYIHISWIKSTPGGLCAKSPSVRQISNSPGQLTQCYAYHAICLFVTLERGAGHWLKGDLVDPVFLSCLPHDMYHSCDEIKLTSNSNLDVVCDEYFVARRWYFKLASTNNATLHFYLIPAMVMVHIKRVNVFNYWYVL